MTAQEKDYFLLLLQEERAGTYKLKEYFFEKRTQLLNSKNNIKSRLAKHLDQDQETKEKYYSQWYYLGVHILTSIPGFNSAKKISEQLGLPILKVELVLEFLTHHGFVQGKEGSYHAGSRHIHLEKEDRYQFHHQLNWRLKSIEQLKKKNKKDIQYAVVYSLSKQDAENIKERILKLIEENYALIPPSKEEVLYCNLIDFFEL